jgi:hypothetical protein
MQAEHSTRFKIGYDYLRSILEDKGEAVGARSGEVVLEFSMKATRDEMTLEKHEVENCDSSGILIINRLMQTKEEKSTDRAEVTRGRHD